MTRGGGGGKAEEQGKVMGPLFPRLHVSDAVKGGGPRAPPRNKMALYEQFTVPSNRFSSSASTRSGGGGLVPSTSASQVYGYDRPLFQHFDLPSNEPARSSEKIKGNSVNGQSNSTRRESGRLSSQTKNNDVYGARSIADCTSQHRVGSSIMNSSRKKMANDDEFMVPSICSPRFPQHSIHEHAGVQEKSVQVDEMSSSIQASKDKFGNKDAKLCSKKDNDSDINSSDNPHNGNNGRQHTSMNGSSMKSQNPTTTKNTVSSKPQTDLDNCNQNSNLLDGSLRQVGGKRKWSLGHHDVEQNDDLSDSSVECIPGWEISPDEFVGAIGPKHFWKARRAIQNQQRVFAVQVFELHRLIKVQKLIAASPHLLIEGDPCLGNIVAGKNKKLPKGNLERKTQTIANKDDVQPALEQQELSEGNSEGKLPSPRDDALGGNHRDQAATNKAFASNSRATTACPDNKQNNWCMNPPQNQWLIPVISPSEGLVYKPYTGPCAPVGSLLAPFYANCTPLRLPSTAYGVPMPHQAQHMAPAGAPALPMNYNYFPPFSLPASAVEQGSHPAASQPNGHVEQQSHISCNMSHPSGSWRFHASRDSELQGSSASSPFDRLQGDGSGPVSFFPAASVQDAQPQPSSGSQDKQGHVIRVVPHKARTASESAARIFRSIQMERQQSDS